MGEDWYSDWPLLFITSPRAMLWASGIVFLVYSIASYATGRLTWKTLPTVVIPINPASPMSSILPHSRKWNPGTKLVWNERHTLYTAAKSETIAVRGLLGGKSTIYTSSPEVIQQVLGNKAPFSRTKGSAEVLGFMGPNVLSTDGEPWKIHRKILAPAFDREGYQRVWDVMQRSYGEMSAAEGWDDQDDLTLASIYPHTRKLSLFTIAACGFNIPLTWTDPEFGDDGRLSVQAMITIVSESFLTRVLTPRWAYYLPSKRLQLVDTAYNRLESFLKTQVGVCRNEILQEMESGADPDETKREIFSRLVAASLNEGKSGLSDREIISNTFILLFAGHDTVALTLSTTLVLLGLYEKEQVRVHEHILNILGDRVPTFDDCEALEPVVLSAVYETMRLYPPAPATVRKADQDTILSLPTADGQGANVLHIPKETVIMLDFLGGGHNPRLVRDANSFDPSRWGSKFDTALPFSDGPRVCLGRKFATTEMVCFLSLMLRDWQVHVPRDTGESREQWRERVLQPILNINMVLPPVPLRLVRRK